MTSVCHYGYTCHLLSLHFNDKPVIVTLASPFTHVQRYPDDLLKTGGVNGCLLKTIFKMLFGRVKRKRTDAPQILHGWEQGCQGTNRALRGTTMRTVEGDKEATKLPFI